MLDASRQSAGTGYNSTVTLFVFVSIFIPAILAVSNPLGYTSVSLALACSALCAALVWLNWKNLPQLSVPSFTTPIAVAK